MFAFADETSQWLAVLVISILFSLFGTALPNLFKHQKSPRPHNNIRLVNECLTRCQLVYIPFFLSLMVLGSFPVDVSWLKNWLAAPVGLALFFYALALHLSSRQELLIARNHTCPDLGECVTNLSWQLRFQLSGWITGFAIISTALGTAIAFLAI